MTVQSDMQKAIAAAESAQGSYLTMSNATQDQNAKDMFQGMAQDVERHINQLKGRLDYLNQNNSLNQKQ